MLLNSFAVMERCAPGGRVGGGVQAIMATTWHLPPKHTSGSMVEGVGAQRPLPSRLKRQAKKRGVLPGLRPRAKNFSRQARSTTPPAG